MAKLTNLSTQRVLTALARAGWHVAKGRRAGGKHHKLIHLTKPGALTIPRSTPLKAGTIHAIIRHAGLTREEFWRLYK